MREAPWIHMTITTYELAILNGYRSASPWDRKKMLKIARNALMEKEHGDRKKTAIRNVENSSI